MKDGKSKSVRIKVISMGNSGVGKSCIIKRYCEKRFIEKYLPTIGIDYGVTKISFRGKELKVNIFDMAGHPFFYEVRNEFYKDCQGVLLVYDIGDRRSFEDLDRWMEEMASEIRNEEELRNVFVVVCANKVDKTTRVVDSLEGKMWSDARQFPYFETSGLSNANISAIFECLFEGILNTIKTGSRPQMQQESLSFSREQVAAIQKLRTSKNNHEKLGLSPGASKEDVNRAYKKLAVLIHPDKNVAPGSEEAFKILVAARNELVKSMKDT